MIQIQLTRAEDDSEVWILTASKTDDFNYHVSRMCSLNAIPAVFAEMTMELTTEEFYQR